MYCIEALNATIFPVVNEEVDFCSVLQYIMMSYLVLFWSIFDYILFVQTLILSLYSVFCIYTYKHSHMFSVVHSSLTELPLIA